MVPKVSGSFWTVLPRVTRDPDSFLATEFSIEELACELELADTANTKREIDRHNAKRVCVCEGVCQ